MVESLRRSVETLVAPYCPACHVEMKWYRATKAKDQEGVIVHYFFCPNCHGISETRSGMQGSNGASGSAPGGPRRDFAPPAKCAAL